jgi:diguanylate cyclase (GGDEF)-like protein/PAS domain S-box-containing protein
MNDHGELNPVLRERRRSMQTLQALPTTWGELVSVLESLSEAFFTLDKQWCFTYLNAETAAYLGRARTELLGRSIWDECPQLRGTAYEAQVKLAAEQFKPCAFELYDPTRKRWKELHVLPSPSGLAVSCVDTSERKLRQDAERDNFLRFQVVARATTDVIFDWDMHTDHVWWSDGVHTIWGYDASEFAPTFQDWVDHVHPDDRESARNSFCEAVRCGSGKWTGEYRFLRQNGSYANVYSNSMIVRDNDSMAIRTIGAMIDVTEQKRTEAERLRNEERIRLQASLLDNAHDAISVADIHDRVIYWNRGAERLFGWNTQEALGKTKAELTAMSDADFNQARQSVLEHDEWIGEIIKRRKDGGTVVVASHLTLARDDNGQPQAVLAIETDITERKEAEQRILNLAFFDPLTHLPNRRLLLDRLSHALAACVRTGRCGALFFLDLDNFKNLNDTLGHDKGDELLAEVAHRLQEQVPRASDTVARHGGDEFVIVLEELSANEQEAAAQAERVAEKILHVFESPFQLGANQVYSSTSVGIVLFDKRILQVDEVLKRGDLAMYQAKGAGRNIARFFDQRMQTMIDARVRMESNLRDSLQRGEFRLLYQRQANDAGRTIGAEVLLRWMHPDGPISPVAFVPLAEETGLILRLGHWVLETACRQLAVWATDPAKAQLTLAVNVSPRQFRQTTFVDEVLELVDRTGADPHRLKLELTESLLVDNVEQTIEHMNALKVSGISFALDDFGTGYSSLAYIKRLPLDQLKIDQSFVRDVLTDPNDAAIARTILGLGQTLGLDVIAEGVETQSQRDFLAAHGCRSYQGFFFGTPVMAEQF